DSHCGISTGSEEVGRAVHDDPSGFEPGERRGEGGLIEGRPRDGKEAPVRSEKGSAEAGARARRHGEADAPDRAEREARQTQAQEAARRVGRGVKGLRAGVQRSSLTPSRYV